MWSEGTSRRLDQVAAAGCVSQLQHRRGPDLPDKSKLGSQGAR
jgi:hypothetical protein